MVYARIADRTVAEERFRVITRVQALCDHVGPVSPHASDVGHNIRDLRAQTERLLGNHYCV